MMLLDFLERLGLQFNMDWDNTITITLPDAVDLGDISKALHPFEERLVREVLYRAQRQRAVFVGGSLNGQMIGMRRCCVPERHPDGTTHRWIVNHLARGRWEVYDQESYDGRAFFRGYATNKRKAKGGEISEHPVTSRNDNQN